MRQDEKSSCPTPRKHFVSVPFLVSCWTKVLVVEGDFFDIREREVKRGLDSVIKCQKKKKKKCHKRVSEIIAVCSFPSSLWVLNGLLCPFAVWWVG